MPLSDDAPKPEAQKSLYLMSVVVKNEYKARWQPRVLNVILAKKGESEKTETVVFRMDDKGTVQSDTDKDTTTYLVRYSGNPTAHTVQGFNAMASAFPIHGFYFVPLHAEVAPSEAGTYYLGSVRAVLRERKGDEFNAGPSIPLIDQAIAGASTGTFDIEITDAYATDMGLFKKTFASLKDVDVKKAVLPKWDRAKAQLFWEKN